MTLTLIDVSLSPYAQKVKIGLREKNLPFEIKAADLLAGDPALKAANPRGEVPALIDDGAAIWDSSIILDYLDEKYPAHSLLPADPLARARARQIEEVCDGPFEAAIFCGVELAVFKRAQGELQAQLLGEVKKSIQQMMAYLEQQLGDRPFFGGDRCGRADCAVFPHVNNSVAQRCPPPEGSRLAVWLAAMHSRPSVQQTLAEAKAGIAGFKAMGEAFMAGRAKRQYRDFRAEWMLQAGGLAVLQEGLAKGTIRFGGLV